MIRLLFLLVVALAVLSATMTGAFFFAYQQLTDEHPVAIVQFEDVSNQPFSIAKISEPDGSLIGRFETYGDQWRIDARFIKMKYFFIAAGFPSRYRLDRFEGRYANINDQNTKLKVSHSLSDLSMVESFSILEYTPFADIAYGTSVFTDIAYDTVYTVYRSPTGLLVREFKLSNQSSDDTTPWYTFW